MAGSGAIRAGAAFVEISADSGPLEAALRRAEAGLKAFASSMESIGKKCMGVAALMAVPFAAATVAFADFEQSMARLRGVLGLEKESADFQNLANKARALGRDTQFMANDVARAMAVLGQSGLRANEIMQAIGPTLNLAAAAQVDLAEAARIAVNGVHGFSLEMDQLPRVVDVLTMSVNTSTTTLQDMAHALEVVAAPAANAGFQIEEVAAAIATLANKGITGERAATGIRGILQSLANPTKEASDALAELDIKVKDSLGNWLPLARIVEQFEEKMSGLGTFDRTEKLGKILPSRQEGILEGLMGKNFRQQSGADELRERTANFNRPKAVGLDTATAAQREFEKLGNIWQGAAGQSRDLAVAAGTLDKAGLGAGTTATNLAAAVQTLAAPAAAAREGLKQAGVEADDAGGRLRPVEAVIGDLDRALGKLDDAGRAQMLARIFPPAQAAAITASLGRAGQGGQSLADVLHGQLGSAASDASAQLREMGVATQLLVDRGDRAAVAAATVGAALESLRTPGVEADAAIKEMGLSLTDAAGRTRPLSDILQQLEEKLAGVADKKGALAKILPMEQARKFAELLEPAGNKQASRVVREKATRETYTTSVGLEASSAASVEIEKMGAGARDAAGKTRDLAVAASTLDKAGLGAGTTAANLAGALRTITTPAAGARAGLKQIGVEADDASGRLRPAQSIIGDLETALSGFDAVTRDEAIAAIFPPAQAATLTAAMGQVGEGGKTLADVLRGQLAGAGDTAGKGMRDLGNVAGGLATRTPQAIVASATLAATLKTLGEPGAAATQELTRLGVKVGVVAGQVRPVPDVLADLERELGRLDATARTTALEKIFPPDQAALIETGFEQAATGGKRLSAVLREQLAAAVPDVMARFREMSAASQILVDRGMSVESASAAVGAALKSLKNPGAEAALALKGMHVEATDAFGNMRSLPDILAQIETALDGVADKKSALAKIMPAEQAARFAELLEPVKGKKGSEAVREKSRPQNYAADIAKTQMDTLIGAWTNLRSSVEAVAIVIGSALAPTLRLWGQLLFDLTNGLAAVFEANASWLPVVAKTAVGLFATGLVLYGVGAAVNLVALSIGGLTAAMGVFSTMSRVVMFAVNPMGLLRLAAMGVGTVLAAIGTGSITALGGSMLGVVSIVKGLGSAIGLLFSPVKLFSLAWAGIGSLLAGVWTGITYIGTALAAVISPMVLVGAAVVGLVVAWGVWTESGRAFFGWFGGKLWGMWEVVSTVFGGITDALTSGEWGVAGKIAWLGLRNSLLEGLAGLSSIWGSMTSGFLAAWDGVIGVLEKMFINLWAGIKSTFFSVMGSISSWWAGKNKELSIQWVEGQRKRGFISSEEADKQLEDIQYPGQRGIREKEQSTRDAEEKRRRDLAEKKPDEYRALYEKEIESGLRGQQDKTPEERLKLYRDNTWEEIKKKRLFNTDILTPNWNWAARAAEEKRRRDMTIYDPDAYEDIRADEIQTGMRGQKNKTPEERNRLYRSASDEERQRLFDMELIPRNWQPTGVNTVAGDAGSRPSQQQEIDKWKADQLKAIEDQRKKSLLGIDQGNVANRDAREKEAKDAADAARKGLDAAWGDLNKTIEEFKAKQAAKLKPPVEDNAEPGAPRKLGPPTGAEVSAAVTGATQGSFSADVANLIGGANLDGQILESNKGQERLIQLNNDLLKEAIRAIKNQSVGVDFV